MGGVGLVSGVGKGGEEKRKGGKKEVWMAYSFVQWSGAVIVPHVACGLTVIVLVPQTHSLVLLGGANGLVEGETQSRLL